MGEGEIVKPIDELRLMFAGLIGEYVGYARAHMSAEALDRLAYDLGELDERFTEVAEQAEAATVRCTCESRLDEPNFHPVTDCEAGE